MAVFNVHQKKGLTVQELCDQLQTLAHHGYAQNKVKVNVLNGYYDVGKDVLKHTTYKNDGSEDVVFLIEGVPM